jgi:Tol biopolymer transport system component
MRRSGGLRLGVAVRLSLPFALCLIVVLAIAAPPAQAAFPGANGKIAFSRITGYNPETGGQTADVFTIKPDGTAETKLTNSPADWDAAGLPSWSADGSKIAFETSTADPYDPDTVYDDIAHMNADGSGQTVLGRAGFDSDPSWSPDGAKIAFNRNFDVATMNADGTGMTVLTSSSVSDSNRCPAWSPDGTRIAFCTNRDSNQFGQNLEIYSMNTDGTNQTNLTMTPCADQSCRAQDLFPAWSPDGTRIAFESYRDVGGSNEIYVMNADGTGQTRLTFNPANDGFPAWSPDGKKIAFQSSRDDPNPATCSVCKFQIYVMNADGSDPVRVTNDSSSDQGPDWQPLPTASYPHPQTASPLRVSLVPAFRQCGTGGNPSNAKHSPPLATDSCNPPRPGSVLAAVGVSSQSSAQMSVTPGDSNPINGNQANVPITASLTDIQSTAGGDYNPNASGADLTAVTRLRFTDKANGYGGLPATATEYDFRVPIDCSSTSNPSIGSSCTANTTANVVVPGLIQEQRQTVVQAFRVRIDDSGANGIRGDSDDRIFMTQGVFTH